MAAAISMPDSDLAIGHGLLHWHCLDGDDDGAVDATRLSSFSINSIYINDLHMGQD
jgi:hypothetical protein